MEELVFLKNEDALTDSLIVAEAFGKDHRKVLRAIDNLVGGLPKNGHTPMFIKTWYKHPQNGERYPKYLMNRDGFSLLVMGFTGKKALDLTNFTSPIPNSPIAWQESPSVMNLPPSS